ncbi:MAG: hypothetical protein J4F28_08175 [Nitrosopumilaceae archaeon]|nr:hypothetical protein [Nitrosopumilaceae archaeon]
MIPPDLLPYAEDGRMVAAVCMLAANAYTDMRRREVAGRDRHYAAVAAAGLVVFAVAEGGWQDLPAIFSMVAGITISLAFWRCRVLSTGDCIVLAAMSAVLPSYGGIYFVPALIALMSMWMLSFLLPMYNLILNILQYASPGGRPLFGAYPRAGAWKRAACMFTAHHKRPWEKYVVPVWEDGDGSFSVRHTVPFEKRNWDAVKTGQLVIVTAPVVPFFLAALLLIVVTAVFTAL